MKKIIPLLLLIGFSFASCTSEDSEPVTTTPEEGVPNDSLPVEDFSVSIEKILYVNAGSTLAIVATTGTITQDMQMGICYSQTSGVTIETGILTDVEYHTTNNLPGIYRSILSNIALNNTYYAKPYIIHNGTVTYGPEVTYEAQPFVTITNVKNISLYKCQVEVTVDDYVSGFYLNFVGTGSIPGAAIIADNTGTFTFDATGNYTVGSCSLQAKVNLPYPYDVADCESNTYGFETIVGQTGEAGGIIILDKGETTDGWRYIEKSPIGIESNATTIITCPGATTQTTIGSGITNTESIVAYCDANSAAKLCYDFTYGGKDDWFLPSADEALCLNGTFLAPFDGSFVTSSGNTGLVLSHHYNPAFITIDSNLSYNYIILPVRRFSLDSNPE